MQTKALARSYFYYPGIDSDIEKMIKSCPLCVHHIKTPPEVTLQSWNTTETPWERIHIDHAGPFQGHLFLIVVDSKTKWLEVEIVKSTDTNTTIKMLQTMFARWGVPKILVSDNATGFTSGIFTNFLERLGVKHARSTPHHPKTNGLAEKMVQLVKNSLSAMKTEQLSLQTKLDRILLKYRITPHVTTGEAPATLMFGRNLRTKLDKLRPNIADRIRDTPKSDLPMREFQEGDAVIVKDYRSKKETWEPCTVEARTTPTSYRVRTSDGATWRRHADQMRSTLINSADARQTPQLDEQRFNATAENTAHKADMHRPAAATPDIQTRQPEETPAATAQQLPPVVYERPQQLPPVVYERPV